MRKPQQLKFFDEFNKSFAHGGELSVGKRKSRRPITTKRAMHVTLRSTRATGKYSFLRKENSHFIKSLLSRLSKRHGVRIYRFAINGNHLHLLIQGKKREEIQNFFRVLSGQLAEHVTKACKGMPLRGKFWDRLLYSRIVEWGREFVSVCKYVLQNELEANGIILYQPRHSGKGQSTIPMQKNLPSFARAML